MARGSNAKLEVIKKLQEAFGDKFVGEFDKKVIVWANDGAEEVQIAIALTCPKTVYGNAEAPRPAIAIAADGGFDFAAEVPKPAETVVEISPEEKEQIERLKKIFDLG